MRKIIDCFLFYNELDMLEYRLALLNDAVDVFILIESAYTFTGKPKPLFYNMSKDEQRFAKYRSKMIHIAVKQAPFVYPNMDPSQGHAWKNEEYQRNCIHGGLISFPIQNEDIIIIADVDEIPDPTLLLQLKQRPEGVCGVFSLEMDFYYYNLTCRMNELWYYTKIMGFEFYKQAQMTCHDIRFSSRPTIGIKGIGGGGVGKGKGGWHLSYFGGAERIKNKIEHFSHQEYNQPQYTDLQKIEKCIATGVDIFHRPNTQFTKVPLQTNPYLPPQWESLATTL